MKGSNGIRHTQPDSHTGPKRLNWVKRLRLTRPCVRPSTDAASLPTKVGAQRSLRKNAIEWRKTSTTLYSGPHVGGLFTCRAADDFHKLGRGPCRRTPSIISKAYGIWRERVRNEEKRWSVLCALRPQALEDATFWEAYQTVIMTATGCTGLHAEFQRRRGKTRELSLLVQENPLHIAVKSQDEHAQIRLMRTCCFLRPGSVSM